MARNASSHHRAWPAVVLLVLSMILPESADAAVSLNPVVSCQTFAVLCGPSEEVCYTGYYESPSPGFDAESNETIYFGNYVNTYDIFKDVPAGTDTSSTNLTDDQMTGIQIIVTRDVNYTCTSVQVNGEVCNSCAACDEVGVGISANCTNVENGRDVICENVEPVFYPLQFGKSNGTDGTSLPDTTAANTTGEEPVSAPTMATPTADTPTGGAPAPMATPTSTDPAASTAVRFEVDCVMRALAGAVGLLLMVV